VQTKTSTIILMLVLVLAGFGVGYGWSRSKNTAAPAPATTASTSQTAAADLRVQLNQLLARQVDLTSLVLASATAGRADYPAVSNQLNTNSQDLQNLINSVYGEAAGKSFYSDLTNQTNFLINYATASKQGDQAAISRATTDSSAAAGKLAKLLASLDPKLSADSIRQQLETQQSDLEQSVTAYGNQDYSGALSQQAQAAAAAGKLADILAEAIVKQYPDKY
jgi:hypothetical protein